jgi:GWxTD domain-containing protein
MKNLKNHPVLNALCLLFLFIILCSSGSSQQTRLKPELKKNDSLAYAAEKLAFTGKTRDAEEILSKITIGESSNADEEIMNGKIALAKADLAKARELFEDALKTKKDNIELHYYYAITCRDLAAKKSYMVHIDQMKKIARDNFEWVIKHDSAYKDVLFQYALYLNNINKTAEAINLILSQIKKKPGLLEPYIGIRNLVIRKFPDNKSPNRIEDFIDDFPDIRNLDYKDYFTAEFLRFKNKLNESKEILRRLLNEHSSVPNPLIYSSLLKIYSIAGKANETEALFRNAVEDINNNLEADLLFYELKYISSPEEISQYNDLSFYDKKNEFFKSFWERHNPNPAMKNNPRILEHYKRLALAEDNYSFFRERQYYYRCKTDEFTDQGLVFLRFGEPDRKLSTSNSNITDKYVNNNSHESASDPAMFLYEKDPYEIAANKFMNSIESWYYLSNDEKEKMEFHFWGKNKKFLTYIADRKALVERSFFLLQDEEINRESEETKESDKYSSIMNTLEEYHKNPDIEADKSIKSIEASMTKERSSIEKETKTFNLSSRIYTFNAPNGRTTIDLAYLINKTYIFKNLPDSINSVKTECNIRIFDCYKNQIVFRTDTLLLQKPGKGSDAEFRFSRFNIRPDSCEISLALHPVDYDIFGKSTTLIRIPDYSEKKLQLSDIETGIEKSSGSELFRKNGKFLLPKASKAHNLKTPLSVYYEIYNLKKNSDGKTMYKMEYNLKYAGSENVLKQLFSGSDRKNSISMEYYQTGKEETAKEFINFELNKLIPGKYILEVKITDVYATKSVKQESEIELYEN